MTPIRTERPSCGRMQAEAEAESLRSPPRGQRPQAVAAEMQAAAAKMWPPTEPAGRAATETADMDSAGSNSGTSTTTSPGPIADAGIVGADGCASCGRWSGGVAREKQLVARPRRPGRRRPVPADRECGGASSALAAAAGESGRELGAGLQWRLLEGMRPPRLRSQRLRSQQRRMRRWRRHRRGKELHGGCCQQAGGPPGPCACASTVPVREVGHRGIPEEGMPGLMIEMHAGARRLRGSSPTKAESGPTG
jgi:hypothetical protein